MSRMSLRLGLGVVVGVWLGVMSVGCRSERGQAEGAALAATREPGMQTAELHVQGTDCASCEVSIRRHLHKLEGIREIRLGSDKQHVFVDFDPKKVTPEQIARAVSDAGYEAEIFVHSVAS